VGSPVVTLTSTEPQSNDFIAVDSLLVLYTVSSLRLLHIQKTEYTLIAFRMFKFILQAFCVKTVQGYACLLFVYRIILGNHCTMT